MPMKKSASLKMKASTRSSQQDEQSGWFRLAREYLDSGIAIARAE